MEHNSESFIVVKEFTDKRKTTREVIAKGVTKQGFIDAYTEKGCVMRGGENPYFEDIYLGVVYKLENNFEQGGQVDRERDIQIAKTILMQLGGSNRLQMFTGAYNFLAVPYGVSFRIKNRSVNYVKIVLNAMDTYDIEFGLIRGTNYKIVKELSGIYNDQLVEVFTRYTGMVLRLKEGGAIQGEENAEMVMNQNLQIRHHTEELEEILKSGKEVPAWVVSKISRAADSMSDATHYLEGTPDKMAMGGNTKRGRQSLSQQIRNEIKALKEMLPLLEGKDKKQVQDAIENLEDTLDEMRAEGQYAKGGGVGEIRGGIRYVKGKELEWHSIMSFDIADYGEEEAERKAYNYIQESIKYWNGELNENDFIVRKSRDGKDYKGSYVVYRQFPKYAKGGGVGTHIDLFEDYENMPPKIAKIFDKYSEDFEDGNYKGLSMALKEMQQLGYTFEYYLDGQAYGLRPIGVPLNQLKGYEDFEEDYAEGGGVFVCPVGTQIQSLIFDKSMFNLRQAKAWAKKNKFENDFVDGKLNTLRIRQKDPAMFTEDGFRTIQLRQGVQAVIGCPKKRTIRRKK